MRRALAVLALALALPSAAQARVHLVRIGSFSAPIYAAAPPGDAQSLFVVERGGRIMVVRRGHKLHTPFLDIRNGYVAEIEDSVEPAIA